MYNYLLRTCLPAGLGSNPEKSFLYRNDGAEFTKIIDGDIVNDVAHSFGNSWGDYDNDGDLDLFMSNADPTPGIPNFLYRNDENGSFTKITGGIVVSDTVRSVGSSWVDYDNDGDLDLWVDNENLPNNPAQNNSLYRNEGGGIFTKITTGDIVNDGGASIGSSWADYDNDGDQDLFVPNQFGENNFLYRNEGGGTFTKITTGDIVNDGGESRACSWADYDNDGDLDLFVTNATGEDNFLYRNEGSGNFTKITTGGIVNDGGESRGSGWADIDNDGDLDLFVANTGVGNNNFLYQNNSDGTFTRILTGVVVNDSSSSWGSSWGDYNKDGFMDLFVAIRGGDNNDLLYQNDGNSNHWINILCIGTVSNTTAIGAKVRVKAIISGTPVWQLRDIAGQRGYASQNSLNAEFGLGDAISIDSLKVEWPSGMVQIFERVQADQYIAITEGDSLLTGLENSSIRIPTTFSLSQNYPNPFNPTTAIRYQLSETSEVELTIYNQLGQEVRTLVRGKQSAGAREVQWDGRDNSEKLVASGVYLYRLRAGEVIQSRKMVLLR